jgi:tetratricopeptide (TPR) repeat protein
VYNNRASLLLQDPSLGDSAIAMYEEAVRIHEALVRQHPSNREYRFELARFLDNLAGAARDQGNLTRAADANAGAIAQIEELVRAAPSLAIEQADAHTVRGSILQETRTADAVHEYEHSLELFRKFDGAYQEVSRRSEFLRRVTDLLERLVSVSRRAPNDPSVRRVVADGVAFYAGLWQHADSSGRTGEAQGLLDDLRDVLGPLSDGDRQRLLRPHEALQRALARTSSGSR